MDPLDLVRRSYDAVAERYGAELSDELDHKPVERAMYAAFAELLGAGARVGDVGCGPGHVTAHLAALGLNSVGIDPSPVMISVARTRHPTLEFRIGAVARSRRARRCLGGRRSVLSFGLSPAVIAPSGVGRMFEMIRRAER